MNADQSAFFCVNLRLDLYSFPLPLPEPNHAQRATRCMSREDCEPDVERNELAYLLNHKTYSERHDHLRDDRDVEWATRVARALQSAGVSQRDGDEQS